MKRPLWYRRYSIGTTHTHTTHTHIGMPNHVVFILVLLLRHTVVTNPFTFTSLYSLSSSSKASYYCANNYYNHNYYCCCYNNDNINGFKSNSNNSKLYSRPSTSQSENERIIQTLLNKRLYPQALEFTLRYNATSSNSIENECLFHDNLNVIAKDIFRSMKGSYNYRCVMDDISIGIEALNVLLDRRSAHPSLVILALHTLCSPPFFRGQKRNRGGYEFGVVVQKKYVPNYQVAYQLLQRLLTGKGLLLSPSSLSSSNRSKSSSSNSFVPKDREFHAVLNACVSAGRMDMARKVMAIQRRTSGKRDTSPDAVTYSIMFKGYGRTGDVVAVDKLMKSVASNHITPDIVMLNSAIDAYVRCEKMDRARALLQSMIENSNVDDALCKPNTRTYNTVLKGLAAEGNIDEAMKLSLDMASLKLHDGVTSNTLVTAAINAGRFNLAEKILSSSDSFFGKSFHDRKSCVEAYTALLDGYAKSGQLEKALGVLRTMKERNVTPNEITYTCAISALALAGQITQAEKMITYMKSQPRIQVSIIAYNAFLTGLLSPDHESLDASLDDRVAQASKFIAASKIRPNTVTINLILDALGRCSPPRMVEARAVLATAEDQGMVPRNSERLYTTLIKGYAFENNLVGVKEAFNSIGKKKDVVALNAYIDACSQCSNIKAGFQAFRDFAEGDNKVRSTSTDLITPDVVTFSTLIRGLAQLDSKLTASKIRELYRDMISRWKIIPDIVLVDV